MVIYPSQSWVPFLGLWASNYDCGAYQTKAGKEVTSPKQFLFWALGRLKSNFNFLNQRFSTFAILKCADLQLQEFPISQITPKVCPPPQKMGGGGENVGLALFTIIYFEGSYSGLGSLFLLQTEQRGWIEQMTNHHMWFIIYLTFTLHVVYQEPW